MNLKGLLLLSLVPMLMGNAYKDAPYSDQVWPYLSKHGMPQAISESDMIDYLQKAIRLLSARCDIVKKPDPRVATLLPDACLLEPSLKALNQRMSQLRSPRSSGLHLSSAIAETPFNLLRSGAWRLDYANQGAGKSGAVQGSELAAQILLLRQTVSKSLVAAGQLLGIWGATDNSPAATIIIPAILQRLNHSSGVLGLYNRYQALNCSLSQIDKPKWKDFCRFEKTRLAVILSLTTRETSPVLKDVRALLERFYLHTAGDLGAIVAKVPGLVTMNSELSSSTTSAEQIWVAAFAAAGTNELKDRLIQSFDEISLVPFNIEDPDTASLLIYGTLLIELDDISRMGFYFESLALIHEGEIDKINEDPKLRKFVEANVAIIQEMYSGLIYSTENAEGNPNEDVF